MISVAKLLDPRTPQQVCMRAYQLFLDGLEAAAVVERLKKEGFTERTAARAVTFLASAFARVHYEKEGLTFPSYFYPGAAAFRERRFLRYIDEPIFQAAMQLAAQLHRDGDEAQVWRFIEISAEHAGVSKARGAGLTPTSFSTFIYEF
jgi:hypothetical protein